MQQYFRSDRITCFVEYFDRRARAGTRKLMRRSRHCFWQQSSTTTMIMMIMMMLHSALTRLCLPVRRREFTSGPSIRLRPPQFSVDRPVSCRPRRQWLVVGGPDSRTRRPLWTRWRRGTMNIDNGRTPVTLSCDYWPLSVSWRFVRYKSGCQTVDEWMAIRDDVIGQLIMPSHLAANYQQSLGCDFSPTVGQAAGKRAVLSAGGSTLGQGAIAPKPRFCPQMWHETLFDELKAYRCKKER